MSKIAFVFPGQGSQKVGMGLDIFEKNNSAKEIFLQADDVLGESLSALIFEGDQSELTKTSNAQPAILTTSIALLYAFQEVANIKADCFAGHSLGEFSAYVAAGSLTFTDAIQLVRKRGLLMEAAVPTGGAMAAILGIDQEAIATICAEINKENLVSIANINCPGQIVISGSSDGVEKAGILAKEHGAKRAIPLDVSGPFHSELMMRTAEQFNLELRSIEIQLTQMPVYTNLTALPDADIVTSLTKQLYSSVQWQETIENMIQDGVDCFVEIGPGKVLAGLVKKINQEVNVYSVYDEQSCVEVAKIVRGVISE